LFYNYHKDVLDTLNTDVRAARDGALYPVSDDLLKKRALA
jgi:hypothetical protein